MARFCIVAPPQLLKALDQQHLMGQFHLLLAHDVVKKPKQYRELFSYDRTAIISEPMDRDRGTEMVSYEGRYWTWERLVILDNSVVELGDAVSIDMIAEAASIVEPNFIVLPDVPLNCSATIERSSNALMSWTQTLKKAMGNKHWQYCILPQGSTIEEWTDCAATFQVHSDIIGMWGIPRNLVKRVGTRREAIRIAYTLNPFRKIHLFGFSDNLIDDVLCAQTKWPPVWSIDSAVPLRYPYDLRLTTITHPRGTWWDDATLLPVTKDNLQTVRKWVSRT